MIRITCHNDNIPERTYSINMVFNTLLGISTDDYEIVFTTQPTSYVIEVNNKRIMVEDHFFIRFSEPLASLNKETIPSNIRFFHGLGHEIPMIYGEDKYVQDEESITIGLDIFASTFFMMSRWEEYALGRENSILNLKAGNFCQTNEDELFCVVNSLTSKAFVHEYEELLRELFQKYGLHTEQKRHFGVVLTHDVDKLSRNCKNEVFNTLKRLFRQHHYKKGLKWINKNIQIYLFTRNRYILFSKYLEISRQYHLTDYFMFKCCQSGDEECTYEISDKAARSILGNLSSTSARIGFHPSQNTFNNNHQFEKEFSRLTTEYKGKILIGRNHRLVHNTNSIHQWEGISVPIISNYGYQHYIGFRCGIVCPFPIFDVYKRTQLKVKELPFSLMETSIKRHYKDLDKSWIHIIEIIDQISKYHGIVCMNWHIRAFSKKEFNTFIHLYSKIINYIIFVKKGLDIELELL